MHYQRRNEKPHDGAISSQEAFRLSDAVFRRQKPPEFPAGGEKVRETCIPSRASGRPLAPGVSRRALLFYCRCSRLLTHCSFVLLLPLWCRCFFFALPFLLFSFAARGTYYIPLFRPNRQFMATCGNRRQYKLDRCNFLSREEIEDMIETFYRPCGP